MTIGNVEFIGSFPEVSMCPDLKCPEYAFIGRSNVGKSSLINALIDRKNLAFTSNKPGKTQLVNLFEINDSWAIADLPGYGYARISKAMREKWQHLIRQYLLKRKTLVSAFVLIDSNIPPQQIDLDFINWLGKMQVPFVLVFTKADKVQADILEENINEFSQKMLEHWDSLPEYFVTSSRKKIGMGKLLNFIQIQNEILSK